MKVPVETVTSDATLLEAQYNLDFYQLQALPVVHNGVIQGIISRSNIALHEWEHGTRIGKEPVSRVLPVKQATCYEDDAVIAIAQRMREEQLCHLLVLDRKHEVTGFVTHEDIENGVSKTAP
jgi:predicted transcriptional regulator